jgi:hypothetical protein
MTESPDVLTILNAYFIVENYPFSVVDISFDFA